MFGTLNSPIEFTVEFFPSHCFTVHVCRHQHQLLMIEIAVARLYFLHSHVDEV